MTKADDKFRTANTSGSANTTTPLTGITRDNFVELGAAFMRANGGAGFVIVRDREAQATIPSQPGVDLYPVTPREWAAWVAWRKWKGLSLATYKAKGWATAPCQWPEGFDADWTSNRSVDAANRFQDAIERQGRHNTGPAQSPEDRKRMVEKLMRELRAI